ncbi:NADH dehydrogenase (ubiquinone) 1 beta subcomplex, partial [Pristimantis euphronides]
MGANQTRVLRGEPDPKTMPASPAGEQFEERVMVATQEQMNLAQLPLKQRDYCAHFLIKYMKCKRDMWPNLFCCKHERHEWEYCQQEEGVYYVQRMKQYERERRLLERQQRREQT